MFCDCRKFFAVKDPAPQQQTKLSFATKAPKKEEAPTKEAVPKEEDVEEDREGDSSTVKNADSELGELHSLLQFSSRWQANVLLDSKKRPRVSDQNGAVKIEAPDDEDDAPVVKRPRRGRAKIEDDEDTAMEETPVAEEKTAAVKEKSASPKPKAKPKKTPRAKSPKAKSPRAKSPQPKVGNTPDEVLKEESAADAESASDAEEVDADEEKPEIAAKAREKVQTQLKTKSKHPYPDWKARDSVPYAALCQTFSLIEMTTKRLIIMDHCSLFLRQVMRLTPDDLLPTVLLMINKLAPDYAGIELGIGESLIMKAIGESTGRSLQVIKADQRVIGDLGLVALKSRSTQPTMFKPKPLTVRGVHQGLMSIATVSGNGAQGRKVDGIKKLLSASDSQSTGKVDISKDKGGPSEAKYIIRFLEGKLRLGLAERTVLVSLAQAIVCHEADQKGKVPTTAELENGESILKTVYRCVSTNNEGELLADEIQRAAELRRHHSCRARKWH